MDYPNISTIVDRPFYRTVILRLRYYDKVIGSHMRSLSGGNLKLLYITNNVNAFLYKYII